MLYGLVIFLSAFLLFQVQLIVAKHLLPWFGGTPAVWTTSQMFFQVLLLGGYTYAHVLSQVRPSLQRRVHVTLLSAAAAVLVGFAMSGFDPLLAPATMKPAPGDNPVALLLTILTATIGLPFFAVSTTGPLLQGWHSRTSSGSLTRTYRLYALSNAGSLLGLVSYPLAVERLLDLPQQAWVWATLFLVFAASCSIVARRVTRLSTAPVPVEGDLNDVESSFAQAQIVHAGPSRIALWLLLSFSGSVVFLATTSQLSQNVAAVPLLWALPLAIFLLTFIICFDRPHWYSRRLIAPAAALAGIVALPTIITNFPVPLQVVAYGACVFSFCMLCHGELVRLRPGAQQLTLFYLIVAVGGALGGTFAGIVAPMVFTDTWEFQIGIISAWIVTAAAWWFDRTSPFHTGDRWMFAAIVAFGSLFAIRYIVERAVAAQIPWPWMHGWPATLAATAIVSLGCCLVVWRRPVAQISYWPRAFVVLAILSTIGLFAERLSANRRDTIHAVRNFYGVVRVLSRETDDGYLRQLVHGNTNHGMQVNTSRYRRTPTAYYTPSTGIAIAATQLLRSDPISAREQHGGIHIGVVGMGVGTISALARPGDRVRYYEINPEVIRLTQGAQPLFTFVRDSAATNLQVLEGDARLVLERELADGEPQQFDLLVMDAFSSDSIPVHLVTLEAFRVYNEHLRSDRSILAVNVSNRYLDIEPVVAANARALGLSGVRVDSNGEPPVPIQSSWILLARDPQVLAARSLSLPIRSRALGEVVVSFTDSYSNILRVVRSP